MYKLIINAKIVTPTKIVHGNIFIDGKGKIKNVIPNSFRDLKQDDRKMLKQVQHNKEGVRHDNKEEVFDAQGKYVLPGLIEVHGHMREPGLTHKEDIPHGTRAALAGGYTTIIDMPNTNPPTTTITLLKEKIQRIYPGRSYTDYAFFLGASKKSLNELKKVNKKDIVGVKVFMAGHETTPTTIPDDETLGEICKILAKRHILFAVHAEDQMLIYRLGEKYKKLERIDPKLWSEIRPKAVVTKAVRRILTLGKKYQTPLYLLHLSTPEEFHLVSQAQKAGDRVFGELVGYQLIFNIKDYKKYGNKIKVSPALRTPEDQTRMWNMVRKGKVDVICSEHSPHEWKSKNQSNVWKTQSGTPGFQETLPALITGWTKRFGKKTLEEGLLRIGQVTSLNTARIFGFKDKGGIVVGKDADLTIIDTKSLWKVNKKDLFSKCGWSAYEGMRLIGRPAATFLRGELVYLNGKIIGEPSGQWLKKIDVLT